jgi:hypothetical protein
MASENGDEVPINRVAGVIEPFWGFETCELSKVFVREAECAPVDPSQRSLRCKYETYRTMNLSRRLPGRAAGDWPARGANSKYGRR